MQSLFIALVALVVIGGGAYWYTQRSAMPTTTNVDVTIPTNTNTNTNPTPTPTPPTSTSTGGTTTGTVKEITVTNAGMTFTQKTLAVKQGDRVKITFQNTGGTHDFRIDGYNVGTKVIQAGQTDTFEFVADKAGSFEYFCSVGNHRAMGMKGTLTVAE